MSDLFIVVGGLAMLLIPIGLILWVIQAIRKKATKRIKIITLILVAVFIISMGIGIATSCSHNWTDATCTTPKTCSLCGETEGDVANHKWLDATCVTPKSCSVCGVTEGDVAAHRWNIATCTTPKICAICSETVGEALGHRWTDATCTNPMVCSGCAETAGNALGHDWNDATCTSPKTCSVCGVTEGEALEHAKGEWVVSQEATVYQVGIREQSCTACGSVLKREEFNPDPVFYSKDFGMSTSEFISIFNKLSDGEYEIKPDGSDYVVSWLGSLDIATTISFTENENGLLVSISLDGREMADNGNRQVEVCWTMFRVLNPHLSSIESMDEFKYAANSSGKEFIRGVRYLYTELSSLNTLWFTIQLD